MIINISRTQACRLEPYRLKPGAKIPWRADSFGRPRRLTILKVLPARYIDQDSETVVAL